MEPFIVVFSGEEQLDFRDILMECKEEGWTPVLVIREENRSVVPYFDSKVIAAQFCNRNFDRVVCGIVEMTPEDVERINERWVVGKGYVLEKFTYPNKVQRRGHLDTDIHEFVEKPDVFKPRARKTPEPFRGIVNTRFNR